MENPVFWNGFEPLLRIIIVGSLTYLAIVLVLRHSGKRTLGSMNAFDFITTVAMGAIFGRTLTAPEVSVSEALVAFSLLVVLQYLISYLEIRNPWISRLITSKPTLLYYKGQFFEGILKQERVHKRDVFGIVRKKGFGSLEEVEAIILETDGSFSVIALSKSRPKHDAYHMVENFKE